MSKLSRTEVLYKIKRYCAYQERSHQEVRFKLLQMKIYGDELEQIIAELIGENYIHEERFAKSFARGKFRMKNWGRNKIRNHLQKKQISTYNIQKALKEIDEVDYLKTLDELIIRYLQTHSDLEAYKIRTKLFRYLYSRGFESEIISKKLTEHLT